MGFWDSVAKPFTTIASGVSDGVQAVASGTVDVGKGLINTAESGVLITRSAAAKIGGDSVEASRLSRKAGSKIKSGGIGLATGVIGAVGGAVDATLGAAVNGTVDALGETTRIVSSDAADAIESPGVKAGANLVVGIVATVATGGAGGEVLASDAAALAADAGELTGQAADLVATENQLAEATKATQAAQEAAEEASNALKAAQQLEEGGATAAQEGEQGAKTLQELEDEAKATEKAAQEAQTAQEEAETAKNEAETKTKNSKGWERFQKVMKLGIDFNRFDQAMLLLCLLDPTLPSFFTQSKYNNAAAHDFRDELSKMGGFIFYPKPGSEGKQFVVPSQKDFQISLPGSATENSSRLNIDSTKDLTDSTKNLEVGMIVSGAGIAPGTRIDSVSANGIQMTEVTTATIKRYDEDDETTSPIYFSRVVDRNATADAQKETLVVDDTRDLEINMKIKGDGIPINARIMEITDSNHIKLGIGAGPIDLAPGKTTKKMADTPVQFFELTGNSLPDAELDQGRMMSDFGWWGCNSTGCKMNKEYGFGKSKGFGKSLTDDITKETALPASLFVLGKIERNDKFATFGIDVMDTETGNAQKWVAPSSFQWGTYVLKSERDCVSNKQNVLDFAKKVQTKGVKGTFQTKARKHLLLVVAVVLAALIVWAVFTYASPAHAMILLVVLLVWIVSTKILDNPRRLLASALAKL